MRKGMKVSFHEGMEGREDKVVLDEECVHLKTNKSKYVNSRHDPYYKMEHPALPMSRSTLPENVKKCVSCPVGSTLPCTCSRSKKDVGLMMDDIKLKEHVNLKLPVVSGSIKIERMDGRNGQWSNLHGMAGGSRIGNLHGNNVAKDKGVVVVGSEGNEAMKFLPDVRMQKIPVSWQFNQSCVSVKSSTTPGVSQLFVKKELMENRVECQNPEPCERIGSKYMEINNRKETLVSNSSLNCSTKSDNLSLQNVGRCPVIPATSCEGINLREWLKPGFHIVNKTVSMHIFTQILELVDMAHSQKVVLQDLRPSSFELLPLNKIKYVGPMAQRLLVASMSGRSFPISEHYLSRKRNLEQDGSSYSKSRSSKHLKTGEKTKFALQDTQSLSTPDIKCSTFEAGDITRVKRQDFGSSLSNEALSNLKLRIQNQSGNLSTPNSSKQKFTYVYNSTLEIKWYTPPEELSESGSTFFSNIYSLGVLLFELLCCCDSLGVYVASMEDLCNRILPSNFLSENPKEAGFCLWLLHPEPFSRPTTREIMKSKLMHESQEQASRDQQSIPVDEEEVESELMLHFLTTLKNEKQNKESKLVEDIRCLEADFQEVEKMHFSRMGETRASSQNESVGSVKSKSTHNDLLGLMNFKHGHIPNKNRSRLTRNIGQLESAYFAVRSQLQLQDTGTPIRSDIDLIESRDILFPVGNENKEVVLKRKPNVRLGIFFDGLCKYARYSKFEQCAVLRNGDLLNSANVICALSFDRDEDYFAAADVSKKIKIFEFDKVLSDSVDVHYPMVEMTAKSKLSCVCWNSYIKNYLASTDYDGAVQLWDASTGQVFTEFLEHERRAWSAEFSQVDPKKLASGSDDGLVKLWSIDEQKSINTIRNKANVCCVQFSAHSTNLLAFGSSDYKINCYDLRNTRIPWCTLAGHGKAVSYVKFLDSGTLVSASTDSTLKLWDLKKTSSTGLSTGACSLTFRGHTNEKNFVGLSVSGGYIACGSETNEVFAYHRSLPMPITSTKFGSIDPISGQEPCDDNGQFVSSVCWRGKSNMVVTANSTGSIKVLRLV